MAKEIQALGATTGATVYVRLWNSTGSIWNGSAFEAYSAGNYANYDIALTEAGASGDYLGDFPSAITTPGPYTYTACRQSGGSPAQSDTAIGVGEINWCGSTPAVMTDLLSGSYDEGAVWFDSVGGTAGANSGYNGVRSRPCSAIADVVTLLAALKLTRIAVASGSTVTLGSTYTGKVFSGSNWTLVLNGQSCTNCTFEGAIVSGTVTGDNNSFGSCNLGAVTAPPCSAYGCLLTNTFTCSGAGTYSFEACSDGRAPGVRPNIDLGAAVGATEVHLNDYSGEIAFQNILTGDEVDVYGMGVIELAVSCTAGELTASPDFTVLNSGTTTVTRTSVGMGGLRVGGDFAILGSQTIASDLTVGGNYHITGTTTHTGAVWYSSTFLVSGTATINALTVSTNVAVLGTTTLTGNVSHGGTTTYTGATTFTGAVTGTNASNDFRINGILPGAAGGVFIAGANAATTVNFTGTITTVTNLTNLPAITANWLTAAGMDATASLEIADAVWDEVLAGHLTSGTTGAALNAASSAGDPWSTVLPGIYGANTAGSRISRIPDLAAGAAGGLFIAGSNAATTVASLTSTGAFSVGSFVIGGVSDIPQTGDSFGRIGVTGSGLTSLAPSATALSTATWTSTRAGYLDNLSAGAVAQQSTLTSLSTTVSGLWTTGITESYAADGTGFTPAQGMYMIWSMLAEKSVSGTTVTCRQVNGSTASMTFTTNSATDPTSISRAT